MLTTLLVCMLATTVVVAQDRLTIATKPLPTIWPPTIGPPTIGPICPLPRLSAEDAKVAEGLNDGSISVEEARASITSEHAKRSLTIIPILRCEDGPARVIHSVPNEFHWPPIWKGSCNNLPCKVPPCFPKQKVWRTRCVLVFKLIGGVWVNTGYHVRRYEDHISCECKQCKHIYNRAECVKTYPCPNSKNECSFCFWSSIHFLEEPVGKRQAPAIVAPTFLPFGRCDCCEAKCCPAPKRLNYDNCRCECPKIVCPDGQVLNRDTCKCECPRGSKPNANGQCIGDCEDIDLFWCSKVLCADNPHFKCKNIHNKCKCPSCDDAKPAQCPQTKCIEQPMKVKCVTDAYTGKCRCPECRDQNDAIWCRKTYCGYNNSVQCKWEHAWRNCFCPP